MNIQVSGYTSSFSNPKSNHNLIPILKLILHKTVYSNMSEARNESLP